MDLSLIGRTPSGGGSGPGSKPQPLVRHLRGVARRASVMARRSLGDAWGDTAYLLGLAHDLGKAHSAWQEGANRIMAGQNVPLPAHAATGAKWLRNQRQTLLAWCVLAHHSGLADAEEANEKLRNVTTGEPEAIKGFHELHACLKHARLSAAQRKAANSPAADAMSVRCLLSVLVDADRLDSEAFSSRQKHLLRTRISLWDARRFLSELTEYRKRLFSDNETSPIDSIRCKILRRACEAASASPGFFDLTVPTGGGKTLSSLEFALRHACAHPEHGFRRVIIVMPYLSIIEQNVAVIRSALCGARCENPDAPLTVLEHHSSVEVEEGTGGEDESREQLRKLAAENWSAPVVVTTSVQFLETLLSNHPTRLRKLHNIARSVVILDEVQTLPRALMVATLSALKCAVEVLGCTIVLSTATQPALEKAPWLAEGLENVRPIIPRGELVELYRQMERVDYDLSCARNPLPWNELVSRIHSEGSSALCIVNTRRHAQLLARLLPEALHFSSHMCAHHRAEVLAQARNRLAEGKCQMISTQAIEAGVDVSFPVVYRAIAPMEGVIQAAGRCNRHGELLPGKGKVVVFEPPSDDGPIAPPDRAYEDGICAMRSYVREWSAEGLSNPEVFHEYSRHLIKHAGADQLDKEQLLEDIDHIRFACIAEKYQLIKDQGAVPVIVPYTTNGGEASEDILARIRQRGFPVSDDYRALQRFTVTLFRTDFKRLRELACLDETIPGLVCLSPHAYDLRLGVVIPDGPPETIIDSTGPSDPGFGDQY